MSPKRLSPTKRRRKSSISRRRLLTDVPSIVTDTSFVQKMQPPPPDGMRPAVGVIVIPGNRDFANFNGMKVFDPSMLDQQPVPQYQARPQYPFEMRRAGIAGEVTVDLHRRSGWQRAERLCSEVVAARVRSLGGSGRQQMEIQGGP